MSTRPCQIIDFTQPGLITTSFSTPTSFVVDLMEDDLDLKLALYRKADTHQHYPVQNITNMFLYMLYNDFATVDAELTPGQKPRLYTSYTEELRAKVQSILSLLQPGDILRFAKESNGHWFVVLNHEEMIPATDGSILRIPLEAMRLFPDPLDKYKAVLGAMEYMETEVEVPEEAQAFLEECVDDTTTPCICAWTYGQPHKPEEPKDGFDIFGTLKAE